MKNLYLHTLSVRRLAGTLALSCSGSKEERNGFSFLNFLRFAVAI